MSDTNILGVIIYLNTTFTDDPLLGIYGNQLRFSESPLTFTDDYTAGYIAKNGVGGLSFNSDFSTGGGLLNAGDVEVTILNKQKYYKALVNLGIDLTGLLIQIREFIGDPTNHASISSEYVFTGYIADLQITSTEITFTAKSSLMESRRANIGKIITLEDFPYAPDSSIGSIVPIMFGSSDPINKRFFKIIRTNAKEIKMTNQEFRLQLTGDLTDELIPDYLFKYPVIETETSSDRINLALGIYDINIIGEMFNITFQGLYAKIIDGVTEIVGVYRKLLSVSSSYDTDDNEVYIDCSLDNFMEKPVIGNATANATDQCWCELYDLSNEYKYTDLDILGFYDSITELLSDFPEIYSKTNDTLIPILETGCDLAIIANTITFNPILFNGAVDTLKSFRVVPFESVSQCSAANLDLLGLTGFNEVRTQSAGIEGDPIGGFYKNPTTALRANAPTSTYTNPTYCLDKNSTTYTRLYASPIVTSGNVTVYGVLELVLPAVADNFKFTKCYIGINVDLLMNYTSGDAPVLEKVIISKMGFYGDPIIIEKEINSGGISTVGSIKNLPDFYYLNTVSNKNKEFIVTDTTVDLTGYKLFDLDVATVNEYRNVYKIFVSAGMRFTGASTGSIDLRYNELSLIFENDQSIESEVYV